MHIKNFKVELQANHGSLRILLVPLLGFQAVLKDMQIHNVEPFILTVDERGMIQNYADRVPVNIVNLATRQATWDSMSVFAIASTPAVQQAINSSLCINDSFDKWDAAIEQAELVNSRAADAVNQVELEMIMDEIVQLNIQQAIDRALDNRDEQLFKQLVHMQRGGVAQ